jgi:hypothetical protein
MTTTTNDVVIRHIRGSYQFRRPVLQAQLLKASDPNVRVMDGSVAQILQACKDKNYTIVNSQEVLTQIVLDLGFAS